jgi:hypothetical protein
MRWPTAIGGLIGTVAIALIACCFPFDSSCHWLLVGYQLQLHQVAAVNHDLVGDFLPANLAARLQAAGSTAGGHCCRGAVFSGNQVAPSVMVSNHEAVMAPFSRSAAKPPTCPRM